MGVEQLVVELLLVDEGERLVGELLDMMLELVLVGVVVSCGKVDDPASEAPSARPRDRRLQPGG